MAMALTLFGRSFGKKAPRPNSADSTILENPTIVEAQASAEGGSSAWLGTRSVSRQLRLFGLMFALLTAAAVFLTTVQIRNASQGTAYVSAAGQLGTQSQALAKAA